MKQILSGVCTVWLFLTQLHAQPLCREINNIIVPYHISITYNKTSNIIFPYIIKSVDRGSEAVLAQKATGVENILQLKAGTKGFEQTNVTVVTNDGKFYSFVVDYDVNPAVLNVSFERDSSDYGVIKVSGLPLDEATFNKTAEIIKHNRTFLHVSATEQEIKLSLKDIYLTGQAMWFELQVKNKSLIEYHPEYFRFFVKDKKRGKRTAQQETEIKPLFANEGDVVPGADKRKYVFAFRPFTIPSTQRLIVQIAEQNGGRNLMLRVSNKTVLKARVLPNSK